MKVLICGGRDFVDRGLMEETVRGLYMDELIHGDAKGADRLAASVCADLHPKCKITAVPADWDQFGKSAGYKRNAEMIAREPSFIVAFWDGESKGTKNTLDLAAKNKIDTLIVYY